MLYLAAEPLADALVWSKGNRYTFRLRPSTYMQASMLAREAAKNPAKRWATIAPNYAYGKDAVAAFKKVLTAMRPDVEFVAEQWPGLFKIDAGAEVQALAAAEPEAIYNVTFGGDLAKFAREGKLRGLFEDRLVVGLLTGEPEYLDPLKGEAPEGWLVTGYPWYDIDTPEHDAFLAAYQEKYDDYPRIGSIVGYNTMLTIEALLTKAGSTDTEAMVDALEGLSFDAPTGPITFRALDHQSTMGAYVGWTTLEDGRGKMVEWTYEDGADHFPAGRRGPRDAPGRLTLRPERSAGPAPSGPATAMEPTISGGAYRLFAASVGGSRHGKTVLVQIRDAADPESGERHAIKRLREREGSRRRLMEAREDHPQTASTQDFEPIMLTGVDEGSLQVVAEVVEVLGGGT